MRKLIKKLQEHGKTFVGILLIGNVYYFYAHDPKSVGTKPNLDYCRDEVDYNLRLQQWKKDGTYILFADEDFGKALDGAIEKA